MPRRSPLTSVMPGALHRDVGAGAHRDADVGLRQRRRVVDAVARHRDELALALQLAPRLRASRPAAPPPARRRSRAARAIASAVVRLSPVSMMTRRPSSCSAGSPRPSSADRVGDAEQPGGSAVHGHETRRCGPSRRAPSARAASRRRRCRARSATSTLPSVDARPSTRPLTPLPVVDTKSRHGRKRECLAPRRPRTMAAASGCSLPRSTRRRQPQQRRLGRSRHATSTRHDARLPSVSVPVLSTTSVSTAPAARALRRS